MLHELGYLEKKKKSLFHVLKPDCNILSKIEFHKTFEV